MNKSKYSPEVIESSVRMVMEAKNEYSSQWVAIESIVGKIGCTAKTLRRRVRQHETDTVLRNSVTTAEQGVFAQAELDRHRK